MHGTARVAHKEIEVKLELAPDDLPALNKILRLKTAQITPKRATEVSVYFDTDQHKLHKKGLMLRIRRVGSRYVQTIKAANNNLGPLERDEWEAEVAGREPDLHLAKDTALRSLITNKLRRQLRPLFETRVQRTVYPIVNNSHEIALAVDRGTVVTGTHALSVCEVELELKRGPTTVLFDFARELAQALLARLALRSKSERGYQLIEGKQERSVKAASIDLPGDANARDAFKTIGLACLKQIVDNEPALIKGDPEGVHQMRVGLRRLRGAMSLFAAILRDPQTAAIKAELKWLVGELGPSRELEVLVQRVISPIKKQRRRWRGMPSLSEEIAERHEAALKRAQNAVQSARFRALALDVAAWLEDGRWRNPQDDLARDRGDLPIAVYAAEQLTRRSRKVRKKGKALAQLNARSRHKLRIHCVMRRSSSLAYS